MCHRLYDSESNDMNVVVFHIPSYTREDCIFVFAGKLVFFTLSYTPAQIVQTLLLSDCFLTPIRWNPIT